MIINVKCPFCGFESKQNNENLEIVCEKCKNPFSTERGSKYYKSLKKIASENVIIAKGEDYLKVDSLLDKGEFYLKNEEFENAYETYKEALTLTNVNYKVYMGLVYALTENLQKTNEKMHEFYLKKAFEVANEDEKNKIRDIYLPYHLKNRLSEEEQEIYTQDFIDNQSNKSKQRLKNCLDKHFLLEKTLKFLKIFLPIISLITVITFILSFVAIKLLFTLITIGFLILILIAFSNYQSIKLKTQILNAVIDLYDNYPNLEISDQSLKRILKSIDDLAITYLNNESDTSLLNAFSKLYKEITKCRSQKLYDFISKYKIYQKCDN